jgi:hypothetical protein
MKPIILAALAPLTLGACNFGLPGGNTATANASAPDAVPDSVTVNGVVYTRAGVDKVPASSTPSTPFPVPSTASTPMPPPVSDGSSTTPADSDTPPSGGEPPAAASGSHGG